LPLNAVLGMRGDSMKEISGKAVLIAIVLVMAADLAIGLGLLVVLGSGTFRSGMSDQELLEWLDAVTLGTPNLLATALLGTLSTVMGGYVAARLAKRAPYLNASMVAALGVLIGVATAKDYPLWFNLVGFGLVLPAALPGGHIAARPKVGGDA